MNKQQKLDELKSKYANKFTPNSLDSKLSHVQLWDGGTMLTAQLSMGDAKKGIGTSYYVISNQAVGTIKSLLG